MASLFSIPIVLALVAIDGQESGGGSVSEVVVSGQETVRYDNSGSWFEGIDIGSGDTGTFSYTFVEAGMTRQQIGYDALGNDERATGFGLGVSLALPRNLYVAGGFTTSEFDLPDDSTVGVNGYAFYLGAHAPVSPVADAFAELGYLTQDLDFENGLEDIDENDFGFRSGLRVLLHDRLELQPSMLFLMENPQTQLGLGLMYRIDRSVGVRFTATSGTALLYGSSAMTFSIRFSG